MEKKELKDMEKKELKDEELKSANAGGGYHPYYLFCPSCGHRGVEQKFYRYEVDEGCYKRRWRVCPKCNHHFET